jgi:hypothetical protein
MAAEPDKIIGCCCWVEGGLDFVIAARLIGISDL